MTVQLKALAAFACILLSFSVFAADDAGPEIRIHHLAPGSGLWLELSRVNRDLFDRTDATKGFVEILLVDRDRRYAAKKEELLLAAYLLKNVPPEGQGAKKYLVGPMSGHASERYLIESGEEILFVTPHWEGRWKEHETATHPAVDVQRCRKIGETVLKGVRYDVLEIHGLYHQYLKVPRELSDPVDWFEYKVREHPSDEEAINPFAD